MKKCYLEISILMVNFIGKCLLLRHCPKSPRPQSDYTTSNEVKESCNFSKSFRLKKIVLQCRLKNKKPVANAIKLLQACIYKSVNIGLFLTTYNTEVALVLLTQLPQVSIVTSPRFLL